jgi:hypothetical protein
MPGQGVAVFDSDFQYGPIFLIHEEAEIFADGLRARLKEKA